jgi:hypothetical protein
MKRKTHKADKADRAPKATATRPAVLKPAPKSVPPDSRKTRKGKANPEQATEAEPFPTRDVQLHELSGFCVAFLDAEQSKVTDPQVIERYKAALQGKYFRVCFSTDTDAYDVLMAIYPLDHPTGFSSAVAQEPAIPKSAKNPSPANR